MRGFLQVLQDLVDHLPQWHLHKHWSAQRMAAEHAMNVNPLPTVRTQMLK
jgi:hypothetical protein